MSNLSNLTIDELESRILYNTNRYYKGESCVSDEEFDQMINELSIKDPDNALLKKTGWGYEITDDNKVKHPFINVGGLDKVKVDPDKSLLNLNIITPKYDGASIELIYDHGILVSAITRGNGEYGQEVMDHVCYIVPRSIPSIDENPVEDSLKKLILHSTISISGEFIISLENLETYFKNEISHRNIASGFLNRKDFNPEDTWKYSFVPYRINAIKTDINLFNEYSFSRSSILDLLNKLFFMNPVPYLVESFDSIQEIMDYFKSKSHFNMDGIVGSSETNSHSVEIVKKDNVYTFKYYEVAYKTISETADVIVNNISWNLTRTGTYIPVVEFDGVELSGAIIQRAMAHNAKNVFDNHIGIGSKIKIVRSGEIIPFILEVIEPSDKGLDEFYCPACGTKLVMEGVNLVCINNDCMSKSYNRVYQWLSYLGMIKGAGYSLYNLMIRFGQIESVNDLYEKHIDWSSMLGYHGIGESKLRLILKIIDKIHQPKRLGVFLVASNIKSISEVTSDKLEYDTNLMDCLINNTPENLDLSKAKGIDEAVRNAVLNNWNIILNNFDLINKYCGILKEDPKPQVDNSNKLKICVTGKLNCGTRNKFFELYKDYAIESDISKCDYLVTNNKFSGSSKNKYAESHNVPILSEEEFDQLIRKNVNNCDS